MHSARVGGNISSSADRKNVWPSVATSPGTESNTLTPTSSISPFWQKGMRNPRMSTKILLFVFLFNFVICLSFSSPPPPAALLTNDIPRYTRQYHQATCGEVQAVSLAPTAAIVTRSLNITAEPHIVYGDLTFLVPSERHAALLGNLYSNLRTAILDAARELEPAANIVLRLGMYTFTIVCLDRTIGWVAMADIAVYLLEQLALATYPLTFSLTVYTTQGLLLWAAGFLD